SRRRHTRFSRDWSSDVCSSDLGLSERSKVWLTNRIFECMIAPLTRERQALDLPVEQYLNLPVLVAFSCFCRVDEAPERWVFGWMNRTLTPALAALTSSRPARTESSIREFAA